MRRILVLTIAGIQLCGATIAWSGSSLETFGLGMSVCTLCFVGYLLLEPYPEYRPRRTIMAIASVLGAWSLTVFGAVLVSTHDWWGSRFLWLLGAGTAILTTVFLAALGLQLRWAACIGRKNTGASHGMPQRDGFVEKRWLLFAGLLSCHTPIIGGLTMTIPLSLWSGVPLCFPVLLVIFTIYMAVRSLRSIGSMTTPTLATAAAIVYAIVMLIAGIAVEDMFLYNGLNVLPFALICGLVLAHRNHGGSHGSRR
jgi:hypothetical protein